MNEIHIHMRFFYAVIFTRVQHVIMLQAMGDNKVYGFSLCGMGSWMDGNFVFLITLLFFFYIKYITSTSEIRGGRKQFIDKANSKSKAVWLW